ncbi:hypothetical protein E4K10_22225 [Streptomyces sp. T1317-0309]|nr:hypothetical protein E4K10_22225 [Streptomyces sp. T1317-0309]
MRNSGSYLWNNIAAQVTTWLYRRLLHLDVAAGLLTTVVGVGTALAASAVGWIDAERLWLLVLAVLGWGRPRLRERIGRSGDR